ncbi:hypothetical protein AB9F43_17640 [Rhizobium leguminosarum]|uniref:hypothetical protein n=1 Tax=Rhizobium leguminosarum TaxID=384 RepID=UPI0004A41730|nr:hypothetical protein [Rhizobium leguminosarum]
MKSLSSQEVVWLLGVFLGVVSIAAAMYLDDKSFLIAQDYKAVLPSIAFIAASTSLVAVAEAFDLAMRSNRQEIDERSHTMKISLVAVNVILALLFAILFAKDISKSSNAAYVVDFVDIAIAMVSVMISMFVTIRMKRALGGIV